MNDFDEPENLMPLPTGDDEAYREYGRQLAMDALLKMAFESSVGEASAKYSADVEPIVAPIASRKRSRLFDWSFVAACTLLVGWGVWAYWHPPIDEAPKIAKTIPPPDVNPTDPAPTEGAVSSGPPKITATTGGWKIEALPQSQFEVVKEGRILLVQGEIHLSSVNAAAPITIETDFGSATAAAAADFFVDTHPPQTSAGATIAMSHSMTRVYVLAGLVALSNSMATISGEPGQLLAAEKGDAPIKIVAAANNGFAFDLYHALSKSDSKSSLFFSPYSLSVALSMTVEGATGATAAEMADLLHIPTAARQIEGSATTIPWQFEQIHNGHAGLSKRWKQSQNKDSKVHQELSALRKQLAEANKQALAFRKAGKDLESNKFAVKSQELASKVNALAAQVDQFELQVANALWGEQTYPFRGEFVDTVRQFYGNDAIFPANFKQNYEGTRQKINAWVGRQTHDKIPELISKNLLSPEEGARVRLVLTNAIYFKGEWTTVFSEAETKEADFMSAWGEKSKAKMMHHGALYAGYAAFQRNGEKFETPDRVPYAGKQPPVYPDDDGFIAIELPYKGNELSMVVIAPRTPEKLPEIEAMLNAEFWEALALSLAYRTVDASVPRFQIDQARELSGVLKSLGMKRAFELPGEGGAEFDRMCADSDPEHKLMIGKVVHSAQVEVNEKGTEAAAATAVIAVAPPSPVPDTVPFTPVFRADRSFVFAVRDRTSGAILFLGRVAKP